MSRHGFDVAVLEMGEDKGGAGDVADFARAGGDVLQGAPAAGEQGEPSFPEAVQGALEGVTGTGLTSSSRPPGGCLTGITMPSPAPS